MTKPNRIMEEFQVECEEPGGKVLRTVRLCRLSYDKLVELYKHSSEFGVLFNNHFQNDLESFLGIFVDMDAGGAVHGRGLAWEVDDVGLLYLTDIRPEFEAVAHFTFWDRRFRGRERLIRTGLQLAFSHLGFHRIVAEVPLYAQSTIRAVERVGFVKEGRKREAVKYKGEWFDTLLYSILERDLEKLEEEDGN